MTDLRVEGLFTAIKSLRQERSCLERKLQTLKMKRENLERMVDSMKTKYNQASDTNLKMKDTLKVSQTKVTQSHAQASTLQEQVDKKREKITAINKEIDHEKQREAKDIEEFDQAMEILFNKLIEARNANMQPALEEKIENAVGAISNNRAQQEVEQEESDQFITMLEQLKIDKEKQQEEIKSCPVEPNEQELSNKVLTEHARSILKAIDILTSRIQQLEAEDAAVGQERIVLQQQIAALEE